MTYNNDFTQGLDIFRLLMFDRIESSHVTGKL